MAQLSVTEGAAMNYTPIQLVENWLVGQGVTVGNATFNGSIGQINSNQVGTFITNGTATTELGLAAGVLLTSGQASLAIGPNNSTGATASTTFGNDPDLDMIAAVATLDKCVLEFDFIPQSDTLKFRYVFGSEEFYEFCNQYNDAFGFFLSGPGITGPYSNNAVNIALMPALPVGVTINNLCADPSTNWANPQGGVNFQYDGISYVMTAWHIVTPCMTYHIKLAIADAVDRQLDSGVFLEKNSFTATGLLVTNTALIPKLGDLGVEGCNNVTISFTLSHTLSSPYTVVYSILGSATRGVDYIDIPDSLVIPPGQDSVALVIVPINDGITEPDEYVVLAVDQTSCSGSTVYFDTITIRDNLPFVMTHMPDTTICQGSTIQLKAFASGGQRPYQYLWNLLPPYDSVMTVTPGIGVQSYNSRVKDLCNVSLFDTVQVSVLPIPLLTNPVKRDTVCSGQNFFVTLVGNVPQTNFGWTVTNPGGHVTGYAAGGGFVISQTLVNNSFVKDSVIYHITPWNSACNGITVNFTVLVNPTPDLSTTPLSKGICNGSNTSVALASNVAGTLFTWTCTQTSGNVTGWSNNNTPAGGINQVLSLSGVTPDSVIYHITPHANGCDGPVYNYTVKVNPIPVLLNNPLAEVTCSGVPINIGLNSSVPLTTFTWTASLTSGSISGFSNGTGPAIMQTLTNLITTPGTVTYAITPASGTCTGVPTNFVVTVNPTPHVTNAVTTAAICSNTATLINLTSDVAITTFSWTAAASSPNLTGFSNGIGNSIVQTIVNNGFTTETVTYAVTPMASGCPGPVINFTVTVYPTPDLTNSPLFKSICSNNPTNLNLTSNVAGAQFTWTCTPSSASITGWADNAVPSVILNQTLLNSGTATESVIYHITPGANGCPGTMVNYTVTVFPTPDLSNSPLSQAQCNNINTSLTLTSLVPGTTFSWTCTPSSVNVTGFSPGAGNSINHTLVNTGFSIENVIYHITPSGNGCNGTISDYTVTVFPVADVLTTPPAQTFCSGGSTGIGLGSNVAGTTFTWNATGSSPNITGFAAGGGPLIQQILINSGFNTEWVTYTITPLANGCTGTMNSAVATVNPLPAVTFSQCFDPVITTTAQPIQLGGGVPVGGTYTGPGVTGTLFQPAVAGPGMHTLTFTYTNTYGCNSAATQTITVIAPVPFACGNTITDVRDSQVYPTVLIGPQCWMATNLNYGGTIPSGQMQRDNCLFEKYCMGDNPANCGTTGGLYQWDEMMKYGALANAQGFCPPDWHVPSEADWNILFTTYISNGFAGSPLKYTGFSGFNALLTGVRFNNVQWDFSNFAIMYWSSTAHGVMKAWAHGMNSFNPSVSFYPSHRNNAFPVRCIKD
jgi:uncharacterized protein (TIGR02145 family)